MIGSFRRVVVIDDYDAHLDVLVTYLQRAGFGAAGFTRARVALQHLIDHPASLVVFDLFMPEMDGIDVARLLRANHPEMPLIGITGSRDNQSKAYLRLLRELGTKICLRKPVDGEAFVGAVHAALA